MVVPRIRQSTPRPSRLDTQLSLEKLEKRPGVYVSLWLDWSWCRREAQHGVGWRYKSAQTLQERR
jgi:hypothetical protein